MKTIGDLVKYLTEKEVRGDLTEPVTGVHYDSRQVRAGEIFVCVVGFNCDAHRFIPDVLAKGVKVLLVEKDVAVPSGITVVKVPDTRRALSLVSAAFYDFPAEKLSLTGVTGTNGKTTVTTLIESILRFSGYSTGLIGTIHNKIGERILPVERTTPESFEVQKLLYQMVENGATHAVMEVSSHALDLCRVADCFYDVAVFTNLTQDHLDYHKTIENYFAAKAALFAGAKYSVLNIDDPYGRILKERITASCLTYGVDNAADIMASEIKVTLKGLNFKVTTPEGDFPLDLHLTGIFNVYNTLAAVGAAIALKIPLVKIKSALEAVPGVDGRFQLIRSSHDFAVVVDYAHTPDGLENILKTAKMFVQGKIISVFGCGGDRDRTKRPIMGKIGTAHSDYAILTSDNPRTEDPLLILHDVEEGAKQGQCPYEIIADRRAAICRAINLAQAGDLVIIAGKGHETYQIFKDKTIHFDDREVAEECLRGI